MQYNSPKTLLPLKFSVFVLYSIIDFRALNRKNTRQHKILKKLEEKYEFRTFPQWTENFANEGVICLKILKNRYINIFCREIQKNCGRVQYFWQKVC